MMYPPPTKCGGSLISSRLNNSTIGVSSSWRRFDNRVMSSTDEGYLKNLMVSRREGLNTAQVRAL